MKRFGKGLILTILAIFISVSGCKVSEDSTAAAEQMTKTAADQSAYYGALADSLKAAIALKELDASFSPVPFDSSANENVLFEHLFV